MASLVVTDVAGHRLGDTRLAWVMLSHVDTVGRQLPALAVIQRALHLMLEAQNQHPRT
jgi:hypothetical protein